MTNSDPQPDPEHNDAFESEIELKDIFETKDIYREIASDAEDYARANEDGWFYEDED